jgi:hypothetical protein
MSVFHLDQGMRSAGFVVVGAFGSIFGAVISFLASSEPISEKRRDELVRKSDDQS